MSPKQISPLDWAFVCMERHDAPMHIGAVAVFRADGEVEAVRLARILAERAQRSVRLRMRLSTSWLAPGHGWWQEQSPFDAGDHVFTHHLPCPGGRAELAALVSELIADPLDLDRPLWTVHVIAGVQADRFAVLVKLHHALADGRAAVDVGLELLDGRSFPPRQQEDSACRSATVDTGSVLSALARPHRLPIGLANAAHEVYRTVRQATETAGIAGSVLRNARLAPASSALHATCSPARRVELLNLDLSDLRRIRTRYGGTTNDVILAVVTGAVRRWLASRGHGLGTATTVRALVPVSHRSKSHWQGHNQLSGYLCELPVGEADPATRLQRIQTAMNRNKAAGPYRGPGALPVLADRLPSVLHRLIAPLAAGGAGLLFDTVITNVPFPALPLRLDGAVLDEVYPLVPLPAGQALSIAVAQYRGNVHIGLHANRSAVPDIEKLSHALPQALAELHAPA